MFKSGSCSMKLFAWNMCTGLLNCTLFLGRLPTSIICFSILLFTKGNLHLSLLNFVRTHEHQEPHRTNTVRGPLTPDHQTKEPSTRQFSSTNRPLLISAWWRGLEDTNNANWMTMFISFSCFCPLGLTIKLHFNISKGFYYT